MLGQVFTENKSPYSYNTTAVLFYAAFANNINNEALKDFEIAVKKTSYVSCEKFHPKYNYKIRNSIYKAGLSQLKEMEINKSIKRMELISVYSKLFLIDVIIHPVFVL